MEDRVAEVTVRIVIPETAPEEAVMIAVPAEPDVARPLLSIVATDGFDELQVNCGLILWPVPSENAPRTPNCWVAPAGVTGDRVMEVNGKFDVVPPALLLPPPLSPPPPHVV